MNKISHIYASGDQIELPDFSEFLSTYNVKIWRPSLLKIIPKNRSLKYIFYWLAHYSGVFRNKNYSAVLVYKENKLISSTIVVPAYFKWPFMGKDDVQYTYSITDKEYRGKGINTMLKLYIRYIFLKEGGKVWGVVDPHNLSSIKVLKKTGLNFYCTGYRKPMKFLPFLYQIIPAKISTIQ